MFNTDTDLSDKAVKNEVLHSFPSVLLQRPDGNNQRLLNIIGDLSVYSKNGLLDVYKCRQLSYAQGKQLDLIAKEYGIQRIDDDDEFLRFEIRVQIMQNITGSSTNELKKMISFVLDIPINMFDFLPTENPEELEITDIPFDFISGNKEETKRRILVESIQNMLPPEYKLSDVRYTKSASQKIYYATSSSRDSFNEREPSYEYNESTNTHVFVKSISSNYKFKGE
ncbi:hypothetical protein IV37_GL000198 [Fructilactobacillus fructivorans]|uniref:hypothetical protein n=1 Tax=Fructilactobacillus fructivorans TaxID=1614 RepID=UPI000704C74C|nr:hypothetical protein [Fructilactobacillus fructivorans]KRN13476.1 hypothetical protein IV37_GL000198 [Fructilactobacillus fructivorans]